MVTAAGDFVRRVKIQYPLDEGAVSAGLRHSAASALRESRVKKEELAEPEVSLADMEDGALTGAR